MTQSPLAVDEFCPQCDRITNPTYNNVWEKHFDCKWCGYHKFLPMFGSPVGYIDEKQSMLADIQKLREALINAETLIAELRPELVDGPHPDKFHEEDVIAEALASTAKYAKEG